MAERSVGRSWTAQEDELLAHAVAIHGEVDNWKAVALLVPGRTNKACRKRWLHSLSPNVKKTAWTPDEDRLLLDLYHVYPAKWAVIARNISGRTDDACSKRYREALDPSLRRDEWTPEEDERLLDAYKRLGGKWGQVGQELQRSGLGCRNRWRLLERKRTTASLTDPQGTPASQTTPINAAPERLSTSREYSGPSAWPAVSMNCDTTPYWEEPFSQDDATPSVSLSSHHSQADSHNSTELQSEPEPPPAMRHAQLIPQVTDYTPFQCSSSLNAAHLSSPRVHTVRYEKSTAVSGQIERPARLGPTASVPPENNVPAVFAHFDFATCSSLPSSSTPPVSQERRWTQDIPQSGIFQDCTSQFHQPHRNVPHAPTIPIHTPASLQPVRDDYYSASARHEERSLSRAAMTSRHPPVTEMQSFRARGSSDTYFTPTEGFGQQGGHISSSIHSELVGSVLDRHDVFCHTSPPTQLDVNAQHVMLPVHDLLPLPGSHSSYPYSHAAPRARAVETTYSKEHRDQCPSHVPEITPVVQPLSRPPTAPPEVHYFPHQPDHINHDTVTSSPRLEPGSSRKSVDQYYPPSPSHTSYASFVRRTHVLPKSASPYARGQIPLDGSSVDTENPHSNAFRPVSRHRARPTVPRKRPDAQAPLRLSSDLPATSDPSIEPYACGHEQCWPTNATSSRACYRTSRGLSDHNKSAHPDDAGGDRPYRCGLEGCGKSWKSINGLQYHLQISKAHFQHAITSTYVTGYIGGLSVPASVEASTSNGGNVKAKKQYSCPHQNCPNRYKQLSGLRYHLAHGHPSDLPAQLDLVPPALSRKLAEKMRFQGSGAQASETATGPAAPSIGSNATLPTP